MRQFVHLRMKIAFVNNYSVYFLKSWVFRGPVIMARYLRITKQVVEKPW